MRDLAVCSTCNGLARRLGLLHVDSPRALTAAEQALAGVPEEQRCKCKAWTQKQQNEQGGSGK